MADLDRAALINDVEMTGRRVLELRSEAIKDANLLLDPLSADQIKKIQTLKSELEGPTLH